MHQESDRKIRVFSGFALDEEAQATLHAILAPIQTQIQGYRWIPPARWHVTAQFYGDISWAKALQLAEAFEALQQHRPRVQLQEIDAFPSMNNPNVLWVGLAEISEPLSYIVEQVHAVGRSMHCPPDDRPFKPHITIGRRQPPTRQTTDIPRIWHDRPRHETSLQPITLFRSQLTQNGPHYTPIRFNKSTK